MKAALIQQILEKLEESLTATRGAAKAAHEVATGPDSKPENQYDTRGIEASYLASAQMKRVEELQKQIQFYRALQELPAAGSGEKVKIGSLIETEQRPRRMALYLLVSEGGGITVELEGKTVNVITPQSPLGEALMGSLIGETIEFENNGAVRELVVKRVL